MKARMPKIILEEDNDLARGTTRPFLMSRNGTCMGMSQERAVWRFGQLQSSEAALVYGIYSDEFTWILADRKTGDVISVWKGIAVNLPDDFRFTLNWGD